MLLILIYTGVSEQLYGQQSDTVLVAQKDTSLTIQVGGKVYKNLALDDTFFNYDSFYSNIKRILDDSLVHWGEVSGTYMYLLRYNVCIDEGGNIVSVPLSSKDEKFKLDFTKQIYPQLMHLMVGFNINAFKRREFNTNDIYIPCVYEINNSGQ